MDLTPVNQSWVSKCTCEIFEIWFFTSFKICTLVLFWQCPDRDQEELGVELSRSVGERAHDAFVAANTGEDEGEDRDIDREVGD